MKNKMKLFGGYVVKAIILLLAMSATLIKSTYSLSKDYTVTINGTSNLHNWNEKVETVTGYTDLTWNSDGSFDLDALSLKMEVHSIKSDMGATMNNNTYKALKADNNPEITFTLTTPIKSVNSGSPLNASGNLTIAGVTNPVVMQVKISVQGHTQVTFEGSRRILMSDYGISPPTALFGTLKTGNEITISFKTIFSLLTN